MAVGAGGIKNMPHAGGDCFFFFHTKCRSRSETDGPPFSFVFGFGTPGVGLDLHYGNVVSATKCALCPAVFSSMSFAASFKFFFVNECILASPPPFCTSMSSTPA